MMGAGSCVIGVDGGNTSTTAVVVDDSGAVVGVGDGGCTDVYGVAAPEHALAELDRVVSSALRQAEVAPGELQAGVFSLAGADWPEDHEYLRDHLRGWAFSFDPVVVNDAMGGLRLGSPSWEGIAVICGTGNAVGARRRDGTCFHLGFWPDTVGAATLSQAALDAVLRHHLDLGPPTSLTDRALGLYGAADPIELQHRFTGRDGLGRPDLVRMSPVLLDEAHRHDAVALEIVTAAGRAMGGQARASAARIELDMAGAVTVLGGGLFQHPTAVLADAVMEELPGAVAHRTTLPPVIGAAMAAYDQIGHLSDPEELDRSLRDFRGRGNRRDDSVHTGEAVGSHAVVRAARERSEGER